MGGATRGEAAGQFAQLTLVNEAESAFSETPR